MKLTKHFRRVFLSLFLLATAAQAETTAHYYNMSSSVLNQLRSVFGLPFAANATPHIHVFVYSDDSKASAFRVTIVTTAGVRTALTDHSGAVSLASFEIDAPGEVKVTVESLITSSVTEAKPQN